MILEALADKLQAASVVVTGVDCFIGLMPNSPDDCVALYEYAGSAPMEVMRDNDATLERPSVQVLVRSSRNDYPTARAKIESIRDVLTDITDETISGVRFLRVSALSSINSVGTDDNERPMFTLALQTVTER